MNVPTDFQAIIQNSTLMVIIGDERADFYLTKNGEIFKIDDFRVPVFEKKFIQSFRQKVKELVKIYKVKEIYLFSPDYLTGLILSCFSRGACLRLRMCAYGNYTKSSLGELMGAVRDIYEKSTGKRMPGKKEALRILENSLRVGKIIGGKKEDKGRAFGNYKLKLVSDECSC